MPLLMSETQRCLTLRESMSMTIPFTGQISNLETVNANNVTLKIEYEGKKKF